jgi:hypothetical protein
MRAVEALPAIDGEGSDNLIARLKVMHVTSNLNDLACEFMAHDEAGCGWLVASEDVKLAVLRSETYSSSSRD